jgi:hypothetical protein
VRADGEIAAGAADYTGAAAQQEGARLMAQPILDAAEDPVSPEAQTDDELLAEARDRYRMCQDADTENRAEALDDLMFLKGGNNQWNADAVAQRTVDGRPIITVNTLPTYLHQVTNDQRMNSPSIKVHPVGDKADIETAKVRQGVIRHIEYDSNADVAYDTSVNSSAAIGFGFFRVVTDWESETSFNQKIVIERIRNALSVKIDPLSIMADGSDMQWCFLECPYSRSEFKRQWPDASASDDTFFSNTDAYVGWLSDQTVLVCDYYRIEKTPATAVLLSNGEEGFKEDLIELPPGVSIVKERKSERSKVMLYQITGCDVLAKTEIKCKWIPVFPVYGDEIDIEGKVTRSGIIRHAKGPAQSYNVMMSAATEEIASRTKAPYIGAEGQFEGHEAEWEQANVRSFPYLEYKATTVDGKLAPPPQRQPMADIPTGYLALAMHSRDNVKATTGLFDSSLGAKGTATSGIQEREQQQQGDMANFHYTDGLLRTLRHAGRCINCMITAYYDTERVAKIMREDGTVEHATINQPSMQQVQGPSGEMIAIQTVLNDMTCGEFEVTVSSGPSYSTLRQEAAEGMADNMAKNPQLWGVIGDLYVKNQDWPGADEMADRIKKTIPPEIKGVEEGEEPPPPMVQTPQGPVPVQQAAQMIVQMMEQLEQADGALKKAGADKQQAEILKQQNAQAENALEAERVKIEQFNAETARFAAEQAADDAECKSLMALKEMQVEATRAEGEALQGDGTNEAFEVWKATLESNTKIQVAQIMARSAERKSEMVAKNAAAKQQEKRPH